MNNEEELFFRVTHEGTPCIVERHELLDMIGEEGAYRVEPIRMTRKKFEALPEFTGF
jgi:hypothetical protein